MKITILTLFPEMFESFLGNSIIKRAIAKGRGHDRSEEHPRLHPRQIPPHRYPADWRRGGTHRKMPADRRCDQSGQNPTSHVVLFSARGSTYNEAKAKSFAKLDHLVLVCGHYEGVDERVNAYCDELLSIGDYILDRRRSPGDGGHRFGDPAS
jgi:tRNA (guanine37-N1)-methyltransferase